MGGSDKPRAGGWTVTWAAGIDVERSYYVFGASGALIFTAFTGLTMLLMLRGRTP